jgi:hypothetical protein
MAGSARRGRRERGRERERAAGRTVHQKSVYVYTMVLYSSRDICCIAFYAIFHLSIMWSGCGRKLRPCKIAIISTCWNLNLKKGL